MGALHWFPGKHLSFSNWTSPNRALFFQGTARGRQWCPWSRGEGGRVRGRSEGAWLGSQIRTLWPHLATVSNPWRRAPHSQTGTVFWERLFNQSQEIINASTDFWVKPQQLNRLQRNEKETGNKARPAGAGYGYRCHESTARVRGRRCQWAAGDTSASCRGSSLEPTWAHGLALVKGESACIT